MATTGTYWAISTDGVNTPPDTMWSGPIAEPFSFISPTAAALENAPIYLWLRTQDFNSPPNVSEAIVVANWVSQSFTSGPGSGVYTKTILLPGTPGQSVPVTIYVQTTDTNSPPLTTQVQRSIIVELPQTGPPSVAMEEPTNGSTIISQTGDVQVQAAASAISPATLTSVQFTLDSITYVNGTVGGDGVTWTATITLPLNQDSTITALATDSNMNTATDSVTVTETTITPPPPVVAPPPTVTETVKPPDFEVFIMRQNTNA